jgi:hypothetical protein
VLFCFVFVLVVLGFELGTSHLLDSSLSLDPLPWTFFCFSYFSGKASSFCLDLIPLIYASCAVGGVRYTPLCPLAEMRSHQLFAWAGLEP